jgi:16S rRNA (uracil1498-N3)-methyltransferase
MPRLNSFHLPTQDWPADLRAGDHVTLAGAEARHLLSVLRGKPGDEIRLFDGAGREGQFVVQSVQGKASVALEALLLSQTPRPAGGITLAIGWNKSSRRDWLLEKAVELGATGLLFWRASRSQGEPPAEPKPTWSEKLIQSAKQCGAIWLPELGCIPSGCQGLALIATNYDNRYVLWEGAAPSRLFKPEELAVGRSLVVVGPEGGLESAEAEALALAGFQHTSLGPRPLRWETAALHCLCLGYHHTLLTQREQA